MSVKAYGLTIERDGRPQWVDRAGVLSVSGVVHAERGEYLRPTRRFQFDEGSRSGAGVGDIFCADWPTAATVHDALELMHDHDKAASNPWTGWCIQSIEIAEAEDDMVRITVNGAKVIGGGPRWIELNFLTTRDGSTRSGRLQSFLDGCLVKECLDHPRELEGRYFSTRRGGLAAEDFGCLSRSLAKAI